MRQKQYILILGCLLIFACGHKQESAFVIDENAIGDDIQLLPNSIPNYEDMIAPLEHANINFQAELMPEEIIMPENYEQIALQTGILLADLSYLRYFNRVNLSMEYAAELESRFLALDLPRDEILFAVEKIERNLYVSDSLLQILNQAYTSVTSDLIQAQRSALAGLIITGIWLESNRLMLSDETVEDESVREAMLQTQCAEFESLIPVLKAFEHDEIQKLTSDITECHCKNLELKSKTEFWVTRSMSELW
ncbi:MAG: hypothetical protein PF448_03470 [Bacteroidales bacterium]|jgi:hypothetical protein|nr:hypothetical protein [Bacteroidales bacterium]